LGLPQIFVASGALTWDLTMDMCSAKDLFRISKKRGFASLVVKLPMAILVD
jgi:hypothetical protein